MADLELLPAFTGTEGVPRDTRPLGGRELRRSLQGTSENESRQIAMQSVQKLERDLPREYEGAGVAVIIARGIRRGWRQMTGSSGIGRMLALREVGARACVAGHNRLSRQAVDCLKI